MRRSNIIVHVLVLGVLLLSGGIAHATSFDVKPIKIYLGAKVNATKLSVRNKGDEELTLQFRVYKWSEDADGKDVYDETRDIILFPKLLKLNKEEERIVRLGMKSPPSVVEKTYRIYAEEIPVARSAARGAEVRFLMKVGVPLFVSPLKPEEHGKIESISMKNGILDARIHNDGNMHFSIQSIELKAKSRGGEEIFSKKFGGWYLLGGASRTYSAKVPKDICPQIAHIDVEVKTENFTLKGGLDSNAKMCQP